MREHHVVRTRSSAVGRDFLILCVSSMVLDWKRSLFDLRTASCVVLTDGGGLRVVYCCCRRC